MRHTVWLKTVILFSFFIVASWSAIAFQSATKPQDHPNEKPKRPDKQVSDLTQDVAAKLPPVTNTQPPAIRNLIDQQIFGAMQRDKVPHAPLANDYEFCRRIYLDLIGRIPTTEQLTAFVNSNAPDKRDKLIDELLNAPTWVDHWSYFYADLFRSCGNRFGNPTLKHFDAWIRESFRANKPYDK